MTKDRNFGVREASLGLTVITCCLVTLGYVLVVYLGGASNSPPVEIRPSQPSPVASESELVSDPTEQPKVLTAEQPEGPDSNYPHTALRPRWLPDRDDDREADPSGLLSPLTSPPDVGRESIWPETQYWPGGLDAQNSP